MELGLQHVLIRFDFNARLHRVYLGIAVTSPTEVP